MSVCILEKLIKQNLKLYHTITDFRVTCFKIQATARYHFSLVLVFIVSLEFLLQCQSANNKFALFLSICECLYFTLILKDSFIV